MSIPVSRRSVLGAGFMLGALAASGCSIRIKSQADPSIPDNVMLLACDAGAPMMQRVFNPYLGSKRTAASYIYEPLQVIHPLTGKLIPWLAETTTVPDAKTIIFTLRTNATWSDGTKLTAKDVGFTFDLLKKYPTLDMRGIWGHIDSFTADGNTVTVALKEEDGPAVSIISSTLIVPEHIWKDVKKPDTWFNENPVGSGPFKLQRFAPQQYSLTKHTGHWMADKVKVGGLILPAATTQLDVVTKGFDWAYSYMSDVKHTWQGANRANKYWFPPGGIISLYPNLTKAPFNNQDFRQALALALDKQKIADAATEGYMQPASQSGKMLPTQQEWLNPDLPNQGVIKQDTTAALAALAKAGYSQQNGQIVDSSGAQLSLKIKTANGYTDWLRAVQEVRKQLTALGIAVEIEQPQPSGYQKDLNNGEFDLAMGAMGGGDDFQNYYSLLSSEYYKDIGQAATYNYERYTSAATDALINQYKTVTDMAQMKQISHQLQQIVYTELPAIALYYGGLWGLYSEARFTGWPTEDNPYAAPQTWDSNSLLVLTTLKPKKTEG